MILIPKLSISMYWTILLFLLYHLITSTNDITTVTATKDVSSSTRTDNDESNGKVILVKIGGSSITDKAVRESIDEESIRWFVRSISTAIGELYLAPTAEECSTEISETSTSSKSNNTIIIVHGAGSFGHFSAKEYGLTGKIRQPQENIVEESEVSLSQGMYRYRKRGLAETRLSVQKLNHILVGSLLEENVNAVGISPCFGIPGIMADMRDHDAHAALEGIVLTTIQAGLVPVLHGDACLYGTDDVGIVSGDTIMEILGSCDYVTDVIFITDVDGVFDKDPKTNPNAQLLKHIQVNVTDGNILTTVQASGSSHSHDVTGGLKVRFFGGVN